MANTMPGAFPVEDHQAIQRVVEREWTAAILARDFERTIALCAEDVVYMPAGLPALHGRSALRAWLDTLSRIVGFEQPVQQLDGQGNLAVACAAFRIASDTDAGRVERTGKALTAFAKDTSGQWLVKAVCWNWDQEIPPG